MPCASMSPLVVMTTIMVLMSWASVHALSVRRDTTPNMPCISDANCHHGSCVKDRVGNSTATVGLCQCDPNFSTADANNPDTYCTTEHKDSSSSSNAWKYVSLTIWIILAILACAAGATMPMMAF